MNRAGRREPVTPSVFFLFPPLIAGFGYLAELDRVAVRVISLSQSWLDYDPAVDDDPELREVRSIQTGRCADLGLMGAAENLAENEGRFRTRTKQGKRLGRKPVEVSSGARGQRHSLWNTIYMNAAPEPLRSEEYSVKHEYVARLSPLMFEHSSWRRGIGRVLEPAAIERITCYPN